MNTDCIHEYWRTPATFFTPSESYCIRCRRGERDILVSNWQEAHSTYEKAMRDYEECVVSAGGPARMHAAPRWYQKNKPHRCGRKCESYDEYREKTDAFMALWRAERESSFPTA